MAHPRNRGREDLGCPFGCREAHQKKQSAERSAAYYGTTAGKKKKAQINSRRGAVSGGDPPSGAERSAPPSPSPATATTPAADAIEFDAAIVEHVRVVTSLIEGFEVSHEAVIAMLQKTVRQRSIVHEPRHDYELSWLAEHPP